MVEINWTIVIYFVIGLFALSGFFKGWWKEAITTFFLGILVLLLQFPDVAQWVIDLVNDGLRFLWEWLPGFFNMVGFETVPQIDASSSQTWLVILILFLALSILIGRSSLPNNIRRGGNYYYAVTPSGSLLGGLLGGLNGFLIINLVREYLAGSSLPTATQPTTEVAMAAGQPVGVASSGVGLTVTDLPEFTVLNDFSAWVFIGFGALLALLVLRNRIAIQRFRIADYKRPRGYKKFVVEPSPPSKK